MTVFTDAMREALQLTRAGDVRNATRVIREALRKPATSAPESTPGAFAPDSRDRGPRAPSPLPHPALPPGGATNPPGQPQGRVEARLAEGRFVSGVFSGAVGTRAYKLWVPSGHADAGPSPLIVMLHGCTQDADDFARGTRMNEHGERHGCCVLYPMQDHAANAQRCWRWFDAAHQRRESGEPAILAGMIQRTVRERGVDPKRVYVAGLSAGGAMAMVLAGTHPELFAAVGVHSGLPLGAARDVPSAFAAMAGRSAASLQPIGQPIPGIVFHGDADRTVRSSNGDRVAHQLQQRFEAEGGLLTRHTATHPTHTTVSHRAADGRLVIEQWRVKGGGHAWFGGDSNGSHTDPGGPDASARLVEFFLAHSRAGAA